MKTVTFFDTREELRELTGLPSDNYDEALWDAGFNLDDWDFGFVSDSRWSESWGNGGNSKYFEWWLLSKMDAHCVGYERVVYKGRYYYMLYHS